MAKMGELDSLELEEGHYKYRGWYGRRRSSFCFSDLRKVQKSHYREPVILLSSHKY